MQLHLLKTHQHCSYKKRRETQKDICQKDICQKDNSQRQMPDGHSRQMMVFWCQLMIFLWQMMDIGMVDTQKVGFAKF